MDKRFLDKVVEQIVSETEVDHEEWRVYTPFSPPLLIIFFFSSPSLDSFFSDHCKGVYGLNKEETEYVWNGYRDTIKDRIKNGL